MRRYAAFDPPEYLSWKSDPELIAAYATELERHQDRADLLGRLDEPRLLGLYRSLLRTRLHDIQLKRWVRTGVISKAWLGTGEEAVTVGTVAALEPGRDLVCPMIRNAGSLHMMGMPLVDMFRGYLASRDAPGAGRDVHLGDLSRGILRPVSQMGSNVPLVAGIALGFKRRKEDRVALTWIGDGASRTVAAHEGINFAAVQRLPVVYVLQNNQVALGTTAQQHGAGSFDAYAAMYGLPGWKCDGNNVLDVFAATFLAVDLCRRGEGPAVILAETFRMGGHATHDEREARETFSPELFEAWGRRDPIGLFEAWLLARGIPGERLEAIEAEVTQEIEAAADEAVKSRDLPPDPRSALYDGFSEGGVLIGLENRPVRVSIGS
jgi:TPP-dependent pyruvate/acetoin dehydrogenase alpha subunit